MQRGRDGDDARGGSSDDIQKQLGGQGSNSGDATWGGQHGRVQARQEERLRRGEAHDAEMQLGLDDEELVHGDGDEVDMRAGLGLTAQRAKGLRRPRTAAGLSKQRAAKAARRASWNSEAAAPGSGWTGDRDG